MWQGLLRTLARHAAGISLNADEMCGRPVAVTRHSAERFLTLGHRATVARRQRRGPPVRHHYGPSDAMTHHRMEDRMQRGRRQDPTCPCRWRHHWLLLAIVPYSVGFTYPGATCRALGAHCSCPTLSYKRLRQAPLPRGRKKEKAQARQAWAQYNSVIPWT
jgi:hypothetical protein